MKLSSIKKVRSLKGKRVLVRVDLNVPLGSNHKVDQDEDWRIRAVLPTIEFLIKRKARVILLAHFGRPKKINKSDSLAPVAYYMKKKFGLPITFVKDCIGERTVNVVERIKNGEVVLLENLRFYKGEQENDKHFAESLSLLGDLYVNDAFAVCHRKAASVVALTKFLPSYAGLLLLEEIKHLEKVRRKPKKPLVVVMGGAKVHTKLPLIEEFLSRAGAVLIGGAVANTALQCKGYVVGKGGYELCSKHLKNVFSSKKIVLPVDAIVGKRNGFGSRLVAIKPHGKKLVKQGEYVQDIGPATLRLYAQYIKKARTVFWNGAVGVFEIPEYSRGSLSVARLIASHSKGKAFGIVGGGETVQALRRTGMEEFVDHVSTGGGALLEFLAGDELPGLEALKK